MCCQNTINFMSDYNVTVVGRVDGPGTIKITAITAITKGHEAVGPLDPDQISILSFLVTICLYLFRVRT